MKPVSQMSRISGTLWLERDRVSLLSVPTLYQQLICFLAPMPPTISSEGNKFQEHILADDRGIANLKRQIDQVPNCETLLRTNLYWWRILVAMYVTAEQTFDRRLADQHFSAPRS